MFRLTASERCDVALYPRQFAKQPYPISNQARHLFELRLSKQFYRRIPFLRTATTAFTFGCWCRSPLTGVWRCARILHGFLQSSRWRRTLR